MVGGEADRYAGKVAALVTACPTPAPAGRPTTTSSGRHGVPRPSQRQRQAHALATHYEPLSRDGLAGAKERLRPLLRLARERGAFVNVDMEHYDAKDLTLALFRSCCRRTSSPACPPAS